MGAKFCGPVGYGESVEQPPESGVFIDKITERIYYGDVIRNTRQLQNSQNLNDNVVLTNSISVIADAFMLNHFHNIRYVKFHGSLWNVVEVTAERPRLILRLGGVYNGPSANGIAPRA